jgi:hypothetical protein
MKSTMKFIRYLQKVNIEEITIRMICILSSTQKDLYSSRKKKIRKETSYSYQMQILDQATNEYKERQLKEKEMRKTKWIKEQRNIVNQRVTFNIMKILTLKSLTNLVNKSYISYWCELLKKTSSLIIVQQSKLASPQKVEEDKIK